MTEPDARLLATLERIDGKLDSLREDLHQLAQRLLRIEGWRDERTAWAAQMEGRIGTVDARLAVIERHAEQAKGAAKAGRLLWAVGVVLASAVAWLIGHAGLKP